MGTKIDTGFNDVTEYMDAIPRGEYLASLDDVNEEESSTGNPMLVWDFNILEGYPGATVRGWTSLLPSALGEAKKFFRGFNGSWKKGDDLEKIARRFRGKKVRLVVGTRTYRDRDSGEEKQANKILGIYPVDQASTDRKAKNKPANGSNDDPDDDIPF